VGFISPVSEPYCGACNRMRLTADGKFHLCLLNDDEMDVRGALRGGGGRDQVSAILGRAVAHQAYRPSPGRGNLHRRPLDVPDRRMIGKRLVILGVAMVALLSVFFFVVPAAVERRLNGTRQRPPYSPTPRARAIYDRLLVADMHADSLLWGRDLLGRGRGHVDVPRLIDAGVAIQAFTVVTKSPRGLNLERNDDRTDNIFWLALAQGWPPKTWSSLKERAAYQARRLHTAPPSSREGSSPCSGRRRTSSRTSSDARATGP
jgi:hypothetical protein